MTENNSYIPLEEAKRIIVLALSEFDTELGQRAKAFITDGQKFNVIERLGEEPCMMACRPAKLTIEELQANDMYFTREEFEEKFDPHFKFEEQDNPNDYAIVDFKYVGTALSVSYLAHEIGHGIAFDIQNECGLTHRDFSPGEMEVQAYFIQSVVDNYIEKNSPFPADTIRQSHLSLGWQRATQLNDAQSKYDSANEMSPKDRKAFIKDVLSGDDNMLTIT